MIPVQWPDATKLAIDYLRAQLPGVTVTRTKQEGKSRQVVVASEFQQLETPISRRATILLEAWSERLNGTADVSDAVSLMNDAIFQLQRAPDLLSNVVRFDQPVGPSVEKDDLKFEYAEGSVVLVIST